VPGMPVIGARQGADIADLAATVITYFGRMNVATLYFVVMRSCPQVGEVGGKRQGEVGFLLFTVGQEDAIRAPLEGLPVMGRIVDKYVGRIAEPALYGISQVECGVRIVIAWYNKCLHRSKFP